MPQSYDFIFKPARDFRESFGKSLRLLNVECGMLNGLYASMNRWRIISLC